MTAAAKDVFIRAAHPVQVTFHRPGKTSRSPVHMVTGRFLGQQNNRKGGELYYRVAGDDGVMYFAPPYWLTAESKHEAWKAMNPQAQNKVQNAINDILAFMQRDSASSPPSPETVA